MINQKGFSIIETLVVVFLASLFLSMGYLDFSKFINPEEISATGIASFLREMRSRSIAETRAYTIYPVNNKTISVKYSSKCSDTTKTPLGNTYLRLENGASFLSTTWSICYNSRGLSSNSTSIIINSTKGGVERVEVSIGGSIKIL